MKELITVFSETLEASDTTETEMSWNLKLQDGEIKSFLAGEIKPNDEQQLIMYRFIFKEKRKIPSRMKAIGPDGKNYSISVDLIDPLIWNGSCVNFFVWLACTMITYCIFQFR